MPLTPEQIDALPTYTASQQLKMWQRASIEIAQNGTSMATTGVTGRQLTRADANQVLKMIDYWAEMVALEDAGANGGGNVLVNLTQEG